VSSILDQLPYPWVDPVAQQLHLTLTRLYPTPQRATSVAERAGVDVSFLDAQQAPVFVWHDILDLAAQSGLTRKLVATARDLLNEQSPLRPFFDDLLTSPLVGRESELAEVVAFPGATAAVPQWLPELRAMEEHCGAASPGLPDTMSQASVFAVQAHELLIECLRQGGDEVQFQRAVQRRLRAPADTQSPTIFGVFILDAHKPGRLPEVLSQLLVVLGMADTVLQAPGTFRFRISATRLDGDTLADLVKAWVVADAARGGPRSWRTTKTLPSAGRECARGQLRRATGPVVEQRMVQR